MDAPMKTKVAYNLARHFAKGDWFLSRAQGFRRGLFFAMCLGFYHFADGQNLNNSGQITNNGLIRVKNEANGLPAVVDGKFEYFGGNQPVAARQYKELLLTGSGTKSLTTGNIGVSDTLTIAPAVTLSTASGFDIDLGGELKEYGYLLGGIFRTVNLSGSTTSSNFGNIGATISWSGAAPGSTTVQRISGVASTGNGNQSILRYYDVTPTFNSNLNVSMVFRYSDNELNGRDANTLELWRSIDSGATWRRQGGTVNTLTRTITKNGIQSLSRWTASDAAHPLGPLDYEWVAKNLAKTSGDSASALVNSTLPPFVVTITDAYGNPIQGVSVTFAIASTPTGATGQNLSTTNATTNASGQASTALTLGSVAGTYTVNATSAGLVGSPATFTATATSAPLPPPPPPPGPVATFMVLASGQNQVDTVGRTLDSAFVVRVLDQNGQPFVGATVRFSLSAAPIGAAGQRLSADSMVTNSAGLAFTRLTLGSSVGSYTVQATSGTLSPISFNATAVAGAPRFLTQVSGNNQVGQIRATLPQPFVVSVTDTFGNAKQGIQVQFAISGVPTGAAGQRLSDSLVTTNANGLAQTTLTLGDSAGTYTVTATSPSLPGSSFTFVANAVRTAPRQIALLSGNNQRGPVTTTLANPLVVVVTDSAGVPVSGVTVSFAITQVPQGAAGQALSVDRVNTDGQGRASTLLTLGNRPGLYVVQASAPGLVNSPITFTATADIGPAAVLVFISGDGQTGEVSRALAQPLRVQVTDVAGNGVQNVPVTFAVDSIPEGASGAFVNGATSTEVKTDGGGFANVSMTLGNRAGVYRVAASSTGLVNSPIYFRLTAVSTGGAVAIRYTAGDRQTAPILTQLPQPLVVTVVNAAGDPVANTPVTFAVDSIPAGATGQDVVSKNVVTDDLGRATTIMRLGDKVGVYRVAASSAGLANSPIHFRLTATHGSAVAMTYVRGDGQRQRINTVLDSLFVVRVTDVGGNTVPGVAVAFTLDSIPSGSVGHGLTIINGTTNTQGEASARLTLGSKVGRYEVRASSEGLATLRFFATATPGSAASLAAARGNNQSKPPRATLDTALVVRVLDAGNNPVPGVAVGFAITAAPAGATGQGLSVTSAVTNEDGEASTVLTLGDRVGMYTVTASVEGVASVSFSAQAQVVVGDVNNDTNVDIADLTTVISHILGRVTLTEADSVRADVNGDGTIDVLDVFALQRYLLGQIPSLQSSQGAIGASAREASLTKSTLGSATLVRAELEATPFGIRLTMSNDVPVLGMQMVLRLRRTVQTGADSMSVIFNRARMMTMPTFGSTRELRLVAYNMKNTPIEVGSGLVFRFPAGLMTSDDIEGVELVISTGTGVHQALPGTVVLRDHPTVPMQFRLAQNYPNPFSAGGGSAFGGNPSTTIEFEVPETDAGFVHIALEVYNTMGQRIRTLVQGSYEAGQHRVVWDGSDSDGKRVASGVYYYRLVAPEYQSAKKMILLR